MKIEKRNNKYYVNDLDLEEVMANRKYVVNYVNKQIEFLRNTKSFNYNKDKLDVLCDIKRRLELRK